jgi:hypothetical protein
MYFCQNFETMKKLLPLFAVIALFFTSCDKNFPHPVVIGGHYSGTFYNVNNKEQADGSLLFKNDTINCRVITIINGHDTIHVKKWDRIFVMNNLITLSLDTLGDGQDSIRGYRYNLEGDSLNSLLKTIPEINDIHVCDSGATILKLDTLDVVFTRNYVRSSFTFHTSDTVVKVKFYGNNQ